jgi:hypothetical protein
MNGFWTELLQRSGVAVLMLVVSTVASFILGRWWGSRRARREWEKKHFLDRINISLNAFSEGRLKIRTIFERSLDEVFLNAVAVEKIRAASLRTTVENPLLPIAKEDCWFLLNFVLNAVAEHFSAGAVRQDAGQSVRVVTYAICLTCEEVGEDRIRKVRAMLVRQELLRAFPYQETMPELENPWHETRVLTLRKAAAVYKTHPENFLHLEVCV